MKEQCQLEKLNSHFFPRPGLGINAQRFDLFKTKFCFSTHLYALQLMTCYAVSYQIQSLFNFALHYSNAI